MKETNEEKEIQEIINARNWIYFLTRPFNLFGVSLWQEWYHSDLGIELFGGRMDVIFVEEYKNVFRSYRPKEEVRLLNETVFNIFLENKRSIKILNEGSWLNERAKRLLGGKEKFTSLKDAVDFFIELGLKATAFPNRIGFLEERKRMKIDKEIITLAENLRKESFYPLILTKIIFPLAISELKKIGVNDTNSILEVVTYNEFKNGSFSKLKERIKKKKEGYKPIYYVLDSKESVLFSNRIGEIINTIEPIQENNEIKGMSAFGGKVKGRVRIVNDIILQEVNFDCGDILVSVSTSPMYLPLMEKAGAIISDDGGITCHAAILSREMKKPCIIGTKIASRVLKDGDIVEVDADNGTVRKIK